MAAFFITGYHLLVAEWNSSKTLVKRLSPLSILPPLPPVGTVKLPVGPGGFGCPCVWAWTTVEKTGQSISKDMTSSSVLAREERHLVLVTGMLLVMVVIGQ
jgi:hypothetical protein